MTPRSFAVRLLVLLLAFAMLLPTAPVFSQVQDGATLTILRGQVAVVRPDGSAVQPAPTGTIVRAGDEIRTLTATGALITFFVGTEIEMGAETILVVERVSGQGARVEVSLRQVLGVTINRVQSFSDPGSSYRIDAGGAVALVRGTEFALLGPISTAEGNVVVLVCGPNPRDCDGRTTFAGQPLAPGIGYFVEVERGRVVSSPEAFKPDYSGGLFGAASAAVTLAEQALQGDTEGIPAGQVPSGQADERRAAERRASRDDDDDKDKQPPLISTSPGPLVPTDPTGPVLGCNQATNSGGAGVTTTVHELGRTGGTFTFSYNAFSIPDRFDITYEGRQVFTTGDLVSGSASVPVSYGGSSTTITVVVTGSSSGTAWNYTVGCPS